MTYCVSNCLAAVQYVNALLWFNLSSIFETHYILNDVIDANVWYNELNRIDKNIFNKPLFPCKIIKCFVILLLHKS